MSERELHRYRFRAMGTEIELIAWGVDREEASALGAEIEQRAEEWESTFSRFRPESELSRVNRQSGGWVRASPAFLSVLAAAREGFIATGGRFDPSIVGSLERIGYDRSFDQLRGIDIPETPETDRLRQQAASMLEVELDEERGAVRLPRGLRIDLGGIAKGAFVDSVADLVRSVPGAIVDAGGDLRCWGVPGLDTHWLIGVQHPGSDPDKDLAQLQLPAGEPIAVATSSAHTRSWMQGGVRRNHLIDPRSGESVRPSSPNVTVVASTVTQAEIHAKSALISIGRGEALPYSTARLVVVAYEDGTYETITPYAIAA